jgi:uncharacterized protein (TIGR02117 family)
MRIIRRLALAFGVALAILAFIGAAGTLIPFPYAFQAEGENASSTKRIFVVSNTLHTDIALPLDEETLASFGFLNQTGIPLTHPNARWMLVGWGGRSFYLETPTLADIKPGPTFRALTIDSSVMHVDVLGSLLEDDPSVMAIAVSPAEYTNLLWAIAESFTTENAQVKPIEGFAFGPNDKFYEAESSFNALLGCNIWTSKMLRSAGIRTGLWNPLPNALSASLRMFNGKRIEQKSAISSLTEP